MRDGYAEWAIVLDRLKGRLDATEQERYRLELQPVFDEARNELVLHVPATTSVSAHLLTLIRGAFSALHPRGTVTLRRADDEATGERLWGDVLADLQATVQPYDFMHWIRPIRCDSVDPASRQVVLSVPDASHRDWLKTHFEAEIVELLGRRAGAEFSLAITYPDDPQRPSGPANRGGRPELPLPSTVRAALAEWLWLPWREPLVRILYAVALASPSAGEIVVAAGPSGVGKTVGIGWGLMHAQPPAAVWTSEGDVVDVYNGPFGQDRTKQIARLRHVPFLVIDDAGVPGLSRKMLGTIGTMIAGRSSDGLRPVMAVTAAPGETVDLLPYGGSVAGRSQIVAFDGPNMHQAPARVAHTDSFVPEPPSTRSGEGGASSPTAGPEPDRFSLGRGLSL